MPPSDQSKQASARIPRATYRLQFSERFRLPDALVLVPYLYDLGVSHIYASPLLKAMPHSSHGYDVCDFHQLNPELGTEADLEQFVAALREHQMGLILDIVPNHMGIAGPENRWWWDVLEHGQASRFAGYFDIDWQSPDPRLRGKVLAPVLADRYDRALAEHKLQVKPEDGARILRYLDHVYPLNQASLEMAATPDKLNTNPAALDELIQQQHYRLACFQIGDPELNYRRFFNIQTMAGLRIEDEGVFNDVHARVLAWLGKSWLDGLRVDHVDGMTDPEQYLQRLRAAAPGTWIVVEKILAPDEKLPTAWPVAGTTGYDFLNRVNGLFVDLGGKGPLTDFYRQFTGETVDFAGLVRDKKCLVLREMFAAEVNRLVRLLVRIAARHWRWRDFPRAEFREAIIGLAAAFPVYRTYIRPGTSAPEQAGMPNPPYVEVAVAAVRRQRPDLAPELFDFLDDLLRLHLPGDAESEFVARFQQLTGPAMAKGVEDTALYCFNRLVSLNEVGGDPGCFGGGVEAFHEYCRHQREHWPDTMLATATHDTNRGEDMRARLNLLSEIPDRWGQAVRRWSEMNARLHHDGWPDGNVEYLFYQTLVGAWPLSADRALAYLEKAAREAKQYTTWTQHNDKYETALREFVTRALDKPEFREDLEQFVAPLAPAGWINSLAQTLLKLTAPGVPDIYQGCELWDFSLVDPDNRRSVDFELRRRLLDEVKNLTAQAAWERRAEGLPKLWLIHKTLALRARQAGAFAGVSRYEPLSVLGTKAGHAVAFIRDATIIAVVPRLVLGLGGDWADTTLELPLGNWRNELTEEEGLAGSVPLGDLLRKFPVALLVQKENV
jgi:(1->4)-alpha-D-glucan 1-alpha-D-glucosylmutase